MEKVLRISMIVEESKETEFLMLELKSRMMASYRTGTLQNLKGSNHDDTLPRLETTLCILRLGLRSNVTAVIRVVEFS